MLSGASIRVPDSGLPVWQEVPLTLLGCAIAVGILYGLYKLTLLPRARRMRRRVAAVEAAAGDGPIFGAAAVRTAATSLFGQVQSAFDAADRERLARVCAPGLFSDWSGALDRNEQLSVRYRVAVLRGPQIDYVGLYDDAADDADFVRVRVRAKLQCCLEERDGSRRPVPGANGAQRMWIEEFWTLSRRDGGWIVWATRSADAGPELLAEEIAGPAR